MGEIWLRFDMRSAEFGIPTSKLARVQIEQASWADKRKFDTILLPEHHGSPDGYNPSPFVLGGAIAARTERIRIHPSAVLLPLHDPVRVAEDAAVLDNICDGRLDITIGLGYVKAEFAMFGVALSERARRADAGLEVLRRAFAGETFEFQGRSVCVRPLPVSRPRPRIFVGGGVPESARRAARLGDGFVPSKPNPIELITIYKAACRELGKDPGPIYDGASGPQFIFVTEDPEKAWAKIAPFALHETNVYKRWGEATGAEMPFKFAVDMATLKASGIYQIVTPDECIALGKSLAERGIIMNFNPTLCGLDEKLSWSSLELFAAKVLPHLKADRLPVGRNV